MADRANDPAALEAAIRFHAADIRVLARTFPVFTADLVALGDLVDTMAAALAKKAMRLAGRKPARKSGDATAIARTDAGAGR